MADDTLRKAQEALFLKRLKGDSNRRPSCTIPRRSTPEPPRSYQQEQLWVLDALHPNGAAYNPDRGSRMVELDDGRLAFSVFFDGALWDHPTGRKVADDFVKVLTSAAADLDAPLPPLG